MLSTERNVPAFRPQTAAKSAAPNIRGGALFVFGYSLVTTGMIMGLRWVFLKR